MKMSYKNIAAYKQGIIDRKNGEPFERNYYHYLNSQASVSWWDKGWKEEDKRLANINE